jgi:hypothetical protein
LLRKHSSAEQRGSRNRDGYLSFDFTIPGTEKPELAWLEREANKIIEMSLPVKARMLKKEEYDVTEFAVTQQQSHKLQTSQEIRAVEIGSLSRELCMGSHVKNTIELRILICTKLFKKDKQTWRLEAVVGDRALEQYSSMRENLSSVAALLGLDTTGGNPILAIRGRIDCLFKELESNKLDEIIYIRTLLQMYFKHFDGVLKLPCGFMKKAHILDEIARTKRAVLCLEHNNDNEEKFTRFILANYRKPLVEQEERIVFNIAAVATKSWKIKEMQFYLIENEKLRTLDPAI